MTNMMFRPILPAIRQSPRQACRGYVLSRCSRRRIWTYLVVALSGLAISLLPAQQANACTPPMPPAVTAIPRTGATEVPTSTSLIILSSGQPSLVTLTANGVGVPVDGVTPLGGGVDGATGKFTTFWRVRVLDQMLPPSADLVLSLAGPDNTRSTVTTLRTAAGYDKVQGTAANLKTLSLLRVRYRLSDIGAGACVFAEYHGYVALDADPALIPGTPPESVISTLTLAPRNGGAAPQSFTFTGPGTFTGGELLPGNYPSSQPTWKPDLDPSLEYCAFITSFGYGDKSRLPVGSNIVCAKVREFAVPGAEGVADGSAADTTDGGVNGEPPASASSSGGCVIAPSSDPRATATTLLSLALAAALRATRRRRHSHWRR
jgi:hypothetical protein